MSTSSLNTFSGGTKTNPDHVQTNDFAITTDFVPRNAAGVPTDEAGDLGTATYRWRSLWVTGTTTLNITNATDIDVYNFFVGFPYVQDDIQEQLTYKAGTLVSMSAKLSGTQSSVEKMQVNVENNGVIVTGTGALSFDNVTSTVQTYVPGTAVSIGANDTLGISIKQVGATNPGNLLSVQVQVTRS